MNFVAEAGVKYASMIKAIGGGICVQSVLLRINGVRLAGALVGQSACNSESGKGCSASYPKFAHERFSVRLHGADADAQLRTDLLVRPATGNLQKNVAFARC